MLSVPRSPCEDSNRQHDYSNNGERSKVHAALHVSLSSLGEQRQDTVGHVDSNDLCRADAVAGVASMDFRSDCISSSLLRDDFIDLSAHRRMQLLNVDDLYAPYDRAGLSGRFLCVGCGDAPCACTKAGVPRESAAIMTDAVKMRMAIPFQLGKTKETPIHEIWLGSDSHVAIQ
jgi:hypothetical protein